MQKKKKRKGFLLGRVGIPDPEVHWPHSTPLERGWLRLRGRRGACGVRRGGTEKLSYCLNLR